MLKIVNNQKIILSFLYLVAVVWFFYLLFNGFTESKSNYYFGVFYAFIPFFGGIFGFFHARKWGNFKSVVGRTIICLSLGLISWSVGNFIFGYYNLFLDISIPYPSVADVAYILSWPLWAIGIVNLSRATGMKFQLKKMSGKIGLFIIPTLVIALSYYLLFVVARGGVLDLSISLKGFFDIFYPIGDVVILSLALLVYGLSLNYLGGKFKLPILLILIGFTLNFFSDFSFSFTTTQETFFVGSWVDFLFVTTMFILSLGVNLIEIKNPKE